MAVGIIIGAAFGAIIASLVKDIIMPPISLLTGGLDFSNKFMVLKGAPNGVTFLTPADAVKAGAITWNYGNFVTLVVNFLIVAFCIFLIVRALNKMKKPAADTPAVSKDCPLCSMTIPIKAKRCPHCTSELADTASRLDRSLQVWKLRQARRGFATNFRQMPRRVCLSASRQPGLQLRSCRLRVPRPIDLQLALVTWFS